MFSPPPYIVASQASQVKDDAMSIGSADSSITPYQRQIQWQRNPSLTDIRSMRVRLTESLKSSSNSAHSISSGSSGIPGIGNVCGKMVKWVGLGILSGAEPLIIRVRRKIISNLIKDLNKVPPSRRAAWTMNKQHKLTRAAEELLELST